MELGWIDFSKTERNKVFNVLDLLGEQGVLDELGISTIRDGFSDLLFPGTSTIQTRAKYFLIVPYALKDLELNHESKIHNLKDDFDKKEEECAHILYEKNPQELGIIGRNAILQNSWVKRTPSNIYLAGLRTYGIFNFKSIDYYLKFITSQKQENMNVSNLGNAEEKEEGIQDDARAGFSQFSNLLNIPTYQKNWADDLEIGLTYDEGQFLKDQIITNCKGSMLAHILENDMHEFVKLDSIDHLGAMMFKFPEKIQNDYEAAMDFSEFVFVLRVLYNLALSDNGNVRALEHYGSLENNLEEISDIDFSEIMFRLKVHNNKLKRFLETSKEMMANGDVEGLKELLKRREIQLKGTNRSRLCHVGEFDNSLWFAGGRLNYRFDNVKVILRDIFESEGVVI